MTQPNPVPQPLLPARPLEGHKALILGIANEHIHDVGMAAAYLATPYASLITGNTFYVDAGLNTIA